MKHAFLFSLVVSLMMAATLCAQDAELPPLPQGPLLKRAPDYSAWTVTFQGHPLGDNELVKTASTGEGSPKEKEPVTMVSSVVKTGSTILEQNAEADGQRHQIWHVAGIRIVAAKSDPMICPDYGGGDIFSTNFASTDFAGLDWLSPTTYSGIVKYQGNDCIVFKGTVSPLTEQARNDERNSIEMARAVGKRAPGALRVPATAYVDLATRLPLFAQFGQEKRIYQYGVPPQAALALPAELARSLKAYEQQMARLSAPASRPY